MMRPLLMTRRSAQGIARLALAQAIEADLASRMRSGNFAASAAAGTG